MEDVGKKVKKAMATGIITTMAAFPSVGAVGTYIWKKIESNTAKIQKIEIENAKTHEKLDTLKAGQNRLETGMGKIVDHLLKEKK